MNNNELPALYRSADTLSLSSQWRFFAALKVHIASLVVTSFLSIVTISHWLVALLQLIALLFALACSLYLSSIRPDRLWYAGRAVAESIKTIAWRYACRAEPFDVSDAEARGNFSNKLRDVVVQNEIVSSAGTIHLDGQQITEAMANLRGSGLAERRDYYSRNRISEQLSWYAKKACYNRRISNAIFVALVAINGLAVVYAAFRIANPGASDWLTEMLVTISASVLAWMQARRYSELASSYSLAANEISLIREQAPLQITEDLFSKFVGDAENAFSREHTQWVARKDA